MEQLVAQVTHAVETYVPNLVAALAVLILGWLVALVVSAAVRAVLRRAGVDERIAKARAEEEAAEAPKVEQGIARSVFWLVMLFVLVAFLQVLGLTLITEPPKQFLVDVFAYAPRVAGAVVLVLIAWILAKSLRLVVRRTLAAAKLDERLGKQLGIEQEEVISPTKAIGDTVYWLVFLLFLPAILSSLALEGLLEPVRSMFDQALGFLPSLVAATVIVVLGWFLARIVQRIVASLLASVGIDRLSERVGLAPLLGTRHLSGVVGLIVYVLILIPVLVAALNALALDAITQPASDMLDTILAAFPAILAASLLLIIAFVLARLLSQWVADILTGLGFNNIMTRLGIGAEPTEDQPTASQLMGYLVLAAVMLFAGIEALRLLGFMGLSELLVEFTRFGGRVILGVIIFAIGLYLANLAGKTIRGKARISLLALAARGFILVLAGAMALRQMGLANEIINIAFGLLLGAIAGAAVLAFGLGGREIAGLALQDWLDTMKTKDS